MQLVAVSPYLMTGSAAAVIAFIFARNWVAAALASATVLATIAVYVPSFVPDSQIQPRDAVTIRVMTANLAIGNSDASKLVQTASTHADILAVQELTQPQLYRMQTAGVDDKFAHQAIYPGVRSSGVGLWSRLPLENPWLLASYTLPFLTAQVRVPGIDTPVSILIVHVANPMSFTYDAWRSDLNRLASDMSEMSKRADPGCAVVIGDFNSTIDMRPYRDLISHGFRDAAEQSGAGLLRTFPGHLRMPPVFGIDHILVRGCRATDVRTVPVAGSDHRGLIASISISRSLGSRRSTDFNDQLFRGPAP
jgi:endonuclease/exonuclease/phosphatase (EEP) superfamily protein YafD